MSNIYFNDANNIDEMSIRVEYYKNKLCLQSISNVSKHSRKTGKNKY